MGAIPKGSKIVSSQSTNESEELEKKLSSLKIEENIRNIEQLVTDEIGNQKKIDNLKEDLKIAGKSNNKKEIDKLKTEILKLKSKSVKLVSINKLNHDNDKKYLINKIKNLEGKSLKEEEKVLKTLNNKIVEEYGCQKYNLGYTGAYSESGLNVSKNDNLDKEKNKFIKISKKTLEESIKNLANYNENNKEDIKHDLTRLIFITSESMRFQCDEKTLKLFATIKNKEELEKIINESKNILEDVQNVLINEKNELNWNDYEKQIIGCWKHYSEKINKFRIEILEQLINLKNINDFFSNSKGEFKKIMSDHISRMGLYDNDVLINELKPKILNIINKGENKYKSLEDKILYLFNYNLIFYNEFFKNIRDEYQKKFIGDFPLSKKNKSYELNQLDKQISNIFLAEEMFWTNLFEENNSCFYSAIVFNNFDLVKILVKINKETIFNKNKDKITNYLNLSILINEENSIKLVELLLENDADINAQDTNGCALLHLATLNNNSKVVELLLDKGAEINIPDKEDNTSLHWATQGENLEIVELLLDNGAEIEVKNKFGETPLHFAAEQNNTKIVKLLIDKAKEKYDNDIDKIKNFINEKNKIGESPLHWATQGGNREIAELLIKNGAEINIPDKEDNTSLHWATQGENLEIVELLLDNGAEIEVKNKFGETPLHFAAEQNNTKIVKLLIDKAKEKYDNDIDKIKNFINEGSYTNYTSLHWATQGENLEIVELLLDNGAEIEVKNKFGETPLHTALKNKNWEIAKLLIKNGAEINENNNLGYTPLDYAIELFKDNETNKINFETFENYFREQTSYLELLNFFEKK